LSPLGFHVFYELEHSEYNTIGKDAQSLTGRGV
jgi:hypothetical protein